MARFILTLIGLALLPANHAEVYHIDFADGNNSADGLSTATAWKHAPGDPRAEGLPAKVSLEPGDVLRFKGGVAYHGSLVLTTSGRPDLPIILDGNSGGTWGSGAAILDGGRVIDSWKAVGSPGVADGNPRWRELFTAEIDANIHPNVTHHEIVLHRKAKSDKQVPWQRVILIDGENGILPVAQHPKPRDPFFPDLPADFIKMHGPITIDRDAERTRIEDLEHLCDLVPGSLKGGFTGFHAGNNHVYFGRILNHDRSTDSLELPLFEGRTYDSTRYAIYNTPALISAPGEWSIQSLAPGKARIILLPPEGSEGAPSNVAFPKLQTALTIEAGASHIHLRGFLIKRYSGGEGGIVVARAKARSRDIRIEDCEIRNLSGMAGIMLNYCDEIVVRGCSIHHNPGWTVGIFLSRVNAFTLERNRLVKNSGSGIRHYRSSRGEIRNNTLIDHHGIHSSGMNLYTGCRDILVENNFLTDIITINRSAERLTLRNNVVDLRGSDGFCIAMWVSGNVGGRHIRDITIENNTLIRSGWSAFMVQGREGVPEPEGVVLRNNILHGSSSGLPDGVTAHNNLFTRKPGDGVAEGNFHVPELLSLIRDPDNGDYRRVAEGPMPETGALGHQY